jgi:hypothetical protein
MQVGTKYDILERQYGRVHEASGRLFPEESKLLEDAIAASFSAYYSLAKASELDARAQHLAALFYRNCIYLSAAYQMIRRGMLDPAGNNMRTIFETIIWQYAYLSDDDVYANFREMNELEEKKIALLPKKEWSNTKERELQNLRRKYSFQKMMKQLYSKELYERFFFNQYWILCQKSHSSIFGINFNTPTMEGTTTTDKNPQELKSNLMALLYLSAENLLCFLNCFSGKIPEELKDSTVTLTNKINSGIAPAPSLVPDTKGMAFKTRLREL